MKLYCNGTLYHAEAPLFTAANRSFRYGEGLFETIRVVNSMPLLWPYHLERLRAGMAFLQLDEGGLDEGVLLGQLNHLCGVNKCEATARARLAVYGTQTEATGYVLETSFLEKENFSLNTEGWKLSLFADVKKSADGLANFKTANYLLYLLAARNASQKGFDESIVLNASGNVCDGSRTNIFLVKNKKLYTPHLNEGCVAGVMRRYVLEHCKKNNIACNECVLEVKDLLAADEVFLTNAIQGMRWVSLFGERRYDNEFTRQLFDGALATFYP